MWQLDKSINLLVAMVTSLQLKVFTSFDCWHLRLNFLFFLNTQAHTNSPCPSPLQIPTLPLALNSRCIVGNATGSQAHGQRSATWWMRPKRPNRCCSSLACTHSHTPTQSTWETIGGPNKFKIPAALICQCQEEVSDYGLCAISSK